MANGKTLAPYWWCQLLGWGAVAPYWFYYELAGGSVLSASLVVIFQVGLQIWATDRYRHLAHRHGWLKLPLLRLLPITFLAWIILVAQYMLMTYSVYQLRFSADYFSGDIALGALAGGVRYHAIWLLGFHLYHFARQSADQAAAAAQNAQLAAEAQLAKLSDELNPHFLFNALNGIKALTREDPALSRLAIDRLAELLRYSLRQSKRELVPFAEERHIVEEYIALEKMRLEERLTVRWDIVPDLDTCVLPPLSLHTLVENAIKHGISPLPAGGIIHVSGIAKADQWVFTVVNDGSYTPGSAGSGLQNLRQRLLLQFGEAASFDIHNLRDDAVSPQVISVLSLPR